MGAVPESGQITRCVRDEIISVLPLGTVAETVADVLPQDDKYARWRALPRFPTDVFAVVGHVARVSGLIGYYNPDPSAADPAGFTLTNAEKSDVLSLADNWRRNGEADDAITHLWNDLIGGDKSPALNIRQHLRDTGEFPVWCKTVLKLMILADAAAEGIGCYDTDNRFNADILSFYDVPAEPTDEIKGSTLLRHARHPASLAVLADRDVVSVQPKSRISQVGCTLRNLTANLALLPPRGIVRSQWVQAAKKPKADDEAGLGVLLIPLPYRLDGQDFHATGRAPDGKPNWDNFAVKQSWLENPSAVTALTVDLLRAAKRQSGRVNGIIFPEYALNWHCFAAICTEAWREAPELEFIIAGSSTNCETKDGSVDKANWVLTALNYDPGEELPEKRRIHVSSRRKHHRWKLDRRQLTTYALAGSLNPAVRAWWEDHRIGTPELFIHRFRQSSSFVTMICEDLARNDPCHEILRSIGPNLVFAILMDGPQLPTRWPARYASSLADDPGSSELTFTSYGLLDRVNKTGRHSESRTIALWKDDTGEIEEIRLPGSPDDSAVMITLGNVERTEQTIDGRSKRVRSWRFYGQQPIRRPVPSVPGRFRPDA